LFLVALDCFYEGYADTKIFMSSEKNPKALAKLSNKVGFNVPTLLDPTLLDRLAAHVG